MKLKTFLFLSLIMLVACQVTVEETVITTKSSDALLSKLEIKCEGTPLGIDFYSTKHKYIYFLQKSGTSTEAVLEYEKSNLNSKVFVNTDTLTLEDNSSNYFHLTVISEDSKTTNTYTVNIFYYEPEKCAMLKEFSVNGQTADGFAPDCYSYKINVTGDSFIPQFAAVSADATVECSDSQGNVLTSGNSYNWGENTALTLTVKITQGTDSKSYTFELNKIQTDVVSNIFYNFSDLSAQFAADGYTTVIAGDSLSVGYGFFGSGFTNAWNTYSGILSWSHMIRDAVHRNDSGFVYADELLDDNKIKKDNNVKTTRWWSDGRTEPTSSYWMPFNNRNVYFYDISGTNEVSFDFNNSNASTNKAVLYFARNPGDTACSFKVKLNDTDVKVKVNDQTCRSLEIERVDLTGNKAFAGDSSYLAKTYKNNFYAGRELVAVEVSSLKKGENKITLHSFENTKDNTKSCGFFFLGCGTKYSPVYLNGRSAATSDFYIDTNVADGAFNQRLCVPNKNNERIAPDCLIWIIGANDSVNGSGAGYNGTDDKGKNKSTVAVEQYKNNLNTVLASLRKKNPKLQIILVSSPVWGTRASNDDPNYEIRRTLLMQYAKAMEEIAADYNAMFLNTIYLFDSLPVNNASETEAAVYWRTDNIHFSRFGHTVLAKNLLSKIMASGIYPKDMIDAEKVYCEETAH